MKQPYSVYLLLLGAVLMNTAQAQNKIETKVIYKWLENGLVHYSHIKPVHANDVTKLDAEGRTIEEFTESFDEIISISVRPSLPPKTSSQTTEPVEKKAITAKAQRAIEQKKKNCATARRNLKTLKGGEVYEKDEAGNMIRLKPEDVASKLKHVSKDIQYFCTD